MYLIMKNITHVCMTDATITLCFRVTCFTTKKNKINKDLAMVIYVNGEF